MSLENLSPDLIDQLVKFHRHMNDVHRQSFDGNLGEVNVGGKAADLPPDHILKVRQAIRETQQFDDDLHGRGQIVFDGQPYRWEIWRYTNKSKREVCDGRLLGYRELMIAFPEDFIHSPPKKVDEP